MGAEHRVAAAFEGVAYGVAVVRGAWLARRDRLWIGLVAIPLAEVATALMNVLWMWLPLTACAWVCAPRVRWAWLLSLELGFVGAMWAMSGATALAHLPMHRLLVGAVWAALPLALAVVGRHYRARYSVSARENSGR